MSEAAIQIEGITKRYGTITALSNVTLNIARGGIFGLLGPNGSGKSTLTKSMLGLVVPDSGKISMLGKSPSDSRYDIGYVPEEIVLYDSLSVVEFFNFIASVRKLDSDRYKNRATKLIKAFDLENRANDFIGSLSKGNRQKVALISTLMHSPKILLLDEPLSGLDPISAKISKNLLMDMAHNGTTIVFSTHVMPFAESLCDEVAILKEGKVAAKGKTEEIRKIAGNLEETFLKTIGADKEIIEVVDALKD